MLRRQSLAIFIALGSLVPVACSDDPDKSLESSPETGDDDAPGRGDGGAPSDDDLTDPPGDGGTSLGGGAGVCAAQEFLSDDGCREASICRPGEFVLTDAGATEDRVCSPCPQGTFSEVDNAVTCTDWRDSSSCHREEWSTPGTALKDVECGEIRHLVSHDGDGVPLSDSSSATAISSDGSTILYVSRADELVDGSPQDAQVLVYDVATGSASAITRSSQGELANGISWDPYISGDGNFACFTSNADNLVPDDTNAATDIFLHDIRQGTTTRIGVTEDGSDPDGGSFECSLSFDGRYVAFQSSANNLLGGVSSSWSQVYVLDRETNALQLMSRSSTGLAANRSALNPKISGDGEFVAFRTEATNLASENAGIDVDIFLADRSGGDVELVSVDSDGVSHAGDNARLLGISFHGEVVVFSSRSPNYVDTDTNGEPDVFARDRRSAATTLVSQTLSGAAGNSDSREASVSSDGRYVAFASASSDLVEGDVLDRGDIFLRDLQDGTTTRVSETLTGEGGLQHSAYPQLSGDGRFTVFSTSSTNFHTFDNDEQQVYLFHR